LNVGVDIGSRGVGDASGDGLGLGLPVGDGTGFGEGCGPAGGSWAEIVKERSNNENNTQTHLEMVIKKFLFSCVKLLMYVSGDTL